MIQKQLFEFFEKKPTLEFDQVVDYTTKRGDHIYYKYASLAEIEKKIKPIMEEIGLAYRWDFQDGGVQAVVFNKEGEEIKSGLIPFMFEGLADPKGVGANITYFKRYSIVALLGLIADEDNERAFMEKSNESLFKIMKQKAEKTVKENNQQEMQTQIEFLQQEFEKDANERNIGLSDKQIEELLKIYNN